MGDNFTMKWALCLLLIPFVFIAAYFMHEEPPKKVVQAEYWFKLARKSGVEYLYKGVPGVASESALIKKFKVKTGMTGRPTPLPKLAGRDYWLITKKYPTEDNLETAPYFIELNVPNTMEAPFGPTPYLECDGQCNWELPGPFGLHGVAGDETRLSEESLGSSGCIRHSDKDITYLYNLLDPEKNKIRYYIEDI